MPTSLRRSLFVGAIALAFAGIVRADYPEKTITFVVPFAAGSATDQLARALGQEVTRITKQAVVVDDKPRGFAPLTLTLTPGDHVLRIMGDGEPRTIPLTVTSGGTVSQFIDLPKSGPNTGLLQIRSDPSGARVSVDGTARGATPVTVDGLSPGTHSVVIANDLGSVQQEVRVEAGATASLVVPMSAPRGAPESSRRMNWPRRAWTCCPPQSSETMSLAPGAACISGVPGGGAFAFGFFPRPPGIGPPMGPMGPPIPGLIPRPPKGS